MEWCGGRRRKSWVYRGSGLGTEGIQVRRDVMKGSEDWRGGGGEGGSDEGFG